MGIGFNRQVVPLAGGLEIPCCGAATSTLPGDQLVGARTFLRYTVEVIVGWVTRLNAAGNKSPGQRIGAVHIRHPLRPAIAMKVIGAALIALGADEIRQHLVPRPAGVAKGGPVIVILTLATHVDQPVDRTGTTQYFAAWPVNRTAVHTRVGLGVIAPVVAWMKHRLGITDRDMQPRVTVVGARLEQQYPVTTAGRQTIRQHTTGRTCPYDDVIEVYCHDQRL